MLKFEDGDRYAEPFPHIVKNDVLSEADFQQLVHEFPSDEDLESGQMVMGGRRRLSSLDAGFYDFLAKSPAWLGFYNQCNCKPFILRMLKLYADDLITYGC